MNNLSKFLFEQLLSAVDYCVSSEISKYNEVKLYVVVRFHAVGHTYCRVKNMDAIF